MRMFHAAPSLLTPYQQKKKDELKRAASSEQATDEPPAPETAREGETSQPPTEPEPEPEPEELSRSGPAAQEPVNTVDSSNEEQKLLDAIFKTEQDRLALTEEVENVSTVLEDLEKQLAEATQTRSMLLEKLPESLIRIRSGDTAETVVADTREAAKESLKPVVLEWHQQATRDIAKDIDGLGPAKLDKLCEEFPTIGDVNNARIAAKEVGKHFADNLPKGCGKSIANQLEALIIEAETNFGTPSAEDQLESREVDESREVVTPGRDPYVRLVTSILRSLQATMDAESLASDQPDDSIWKAGIDARKSDQPVESIPRYDGEDKNQKVTDWVKGWLIADLESSNEQEEVTDDPTLSEDAGTDAGTEPSKDAPKPGTDSSMEPTQPKGSGLSGPSANAEPEPADPDTGPPPTIDPETHSLAVQEIAEQVKAGNDMRQEDGNEHWAQGHATAIDELPIETCPSNLSPADQIQWIKGWMYGDSFAGAL